MGPKLETSPEMNLSLSSCAWSLITTDFSLHTTLEFISIWESLGWESWPVHNPTLSFLGNPKLETLGSTPFILASSLRLVLGFPKHLNSGLPRLFHLRSHKIIKISSILATLWTLRKPQTNYKSRVQCLTYCITPQRKNNIKPWLWYRVSHIILDRL